MNFQFVFTGRDETHQALPWSQFSEFGHRSRSLTGFGSRHQTWNHSLFPVSLGQWWIDKVPFIYYVSTCIAQNLIWLPNFSQKLRFFLSKQKNFFFNITFWPTFHVEVCDFLVHNEEKRMLKKFVKMLRLIKKYLRNIWMAP